MTHFADRFFPGRSGRRDDSPDENDQDEDGPSGGGGGKPQQKSATKKRGNDLFFFSKKKNPYFSPKLDILNALFFLLKTDYDAKIFISYRTVSRFYENS